MGRAVRSIDYIIMGIYLIVVVGIGFAFRKHNKSNLDFFLAGRSMGWLPIGLSVMVTAFSVINYMAFPTEVFANGAYVLISLPIFFLAAYLVSEIWLPRLYEMKLSCVYEYFQSRFSTRVRILASVVFIFWRVFWMATALYAAGMLLSKISGLNIYYVILICGVVATTYTGIGGIRAVMWTDCLQFLVLFGGIVFAVIVVLQNSNIDDFINIAKSGGRLQPFYPIDHKFFSLDPTVRISFFSGVIGVTVAFLTRYGADQVVVQRYFTARSIADAKKGIWLNAFVAFIALLLLAVFGIAIYVNGVNSGALGGIDINKLSVASKKALAMKEFIIAIKHLPPGVFGLIVSGLLAATMSSIDSGINACTNAWVNDILPTFKKFENKDNSSRFWVYSLGGVCTISGIILVPLVGQTKSLFVIVNQIVNALGSPLLALFIAGFYLKRVNSSGAFWGGIIGFAFSIIFSLFYNGISLHYYAVINLIVTLVVIYLFSIVSDKFRR